MKRVAGLLLAVLLLAGCGGGATVAESDRPLLVAAASDLGPAFEELREIYAARTGRQVTVTLGSSGQLSQQLVNGAPYELFASASERYVDDVLAGGRGDVRTKALYAVGRLAVWVPHDGAVTPKPIAVAELADARFRRIAIANPAHAPYGLAAQQALASSGLVPRVRDRLVLGESVSDTLRLATSGNADAAIVALSLVIARDGGSWTPVPASAHAPLRQSLVVTAEGERVGAAQAFADLVSSEQGRAVMRRYGFVLPGEPAPGDLPRGAALAGEPPSSEAPDPDSRSSTPSG